MKLKTKILALFCACFMLLNIVDMIIPRSEAKIFDNAVRLHILATDNSEAAQSLKLTVRDAILEEYGELFENNANINEASASVTENLSAIERTANRVLSENGANYNAVAEWGYEEYPTRVYENVTLPAGTYRSLRIKLGSGEGNNWWCVLFPPLCTKAASDNNDLSSSGVNSNDSAVFTSKKYLFRFKLLELFGG